MRDVEMRMLKWMCGHTKLDQIENEDLQKKVGGTIDYRQDAGTSARWFSHIHPRPIHAPLRREVLYL